MCVCAVAGVVRAGVCVSAIHLDEDGGDEGARLGGGHQRREEHAWFVPGKVICVFRGLAY